MKYFEVICVVKILSTITNNKTMELVENLLFLMNLKLIASYYVLVDQDFQLQKLMKVSICSYKNRPSVNNRHN